MPGAGREFRGDRRAHDFVHNPLRPLETARSEKPDWKAAFDLGSAEDAKVLPPNMPLAAMGSNPCSRKADVTVFWWREPGL